MVGADAAQRQSRNRALWAALTRAGLVVSVPGGFGCGWSCTVTRTVHGLSINAAFSTVGSEEEESPNVNE